MPPASPPASDTNGTDDAAGQDEAADRQVRALAAVWRAQTLGIAYLEGSTVRVCEVGDAAPDFQMLDALKFELNPKLIVVPSSSSADWLTRVSAPLYRSSRTVEAEDGTDPHDDAASDHDTGFKLVYSKSRDFTPAAAARRLALLSACSVTGDRDLCEREILLHFEHIVPREEETALRAVGGLLSFLQQLNTSAPVSVTSLERHRMERILRVSPETLFALNIFEDKLHPSIHGGRKKEGFSVWGMMNQTRSKAGEHLFRSWFARPSQDASVLNERLDTIEFFVARVDLLPLLQANLVKSKDISRLNASFESGGLLLKDYQNAMSTAATAVKLRELLASADVPLDQVPVAARLHQACNTELADIANMIMQVVDFEGSRSARIKPDICIHDGVSTDLDDLRAEYASMQGLLTRVARAEYDRLSDCGMLPDFAVNGASDEDELYIIYASQYGFMLKMALPRVLPFEEGATMQHFRAAGLALQFHECGEGYFKTQRCEELDAQYGDIGFRMKDIEAQIIRLLESTLLQSLPSLLAAQAALAELDCFLALAACASQFNFVRPELSEQNATEITDGWHPLLQVQGPVAQVVPNSCVLGVPTRRPQTARGSVPSTNDGPAGDATSGHLMLMTGPNASGKSVYLRTVGIITFLAHVGSFVPAAAARIGITDAIYTRMVSKESAVANASAFMLDLSQMALMIRHATGRSLCLIDEFGKGTYAQDGICMLYACLTHLVNRGAECPRTIACTHFTELLTISSFVQQPRLTLWTMKVLQQDEAGSINRVAHGPLALLDDAIFLYRAVPGQCVDSFGWHCALSAGVPQDVIERARHLAECRRTGQPLLPKARGEDGQDGANANDILRRGFDMVDDFLEWEFKEKGASAFFERHVDALEGLRQGPR